MFVLPVIELHYPDSILQLSQGGASFPAGYENIFATNDYRGFGVGLRREFKMS
jgi:hypothetical protein